MKHGGQQTYNHSVFVENEDINCISIYKLSDNTTHPRKVSIFKISFSVTTANREFTLAIISLRKFIHDPGDGHCPLTRGSEPIRFLRIPKTASFYMLIMVVLRVRNLRGYLTISRTRIVYGVTDNHQRDTDITNLLLEVSPEGLAHS